MDYFLYKLKFLGGLHAGGDSGQNNLESCESSVHSDTLFSALCGEAVRGGGAALDALVKLFADGRAILSDAMPFRGDEYFLPKPAFGGRGRLILTDARDRKLLKKLAFLPVSMFGAFLRASEEEPFDIRRAVRAGRDLFCRDRRVCVAVRGEEQPRPYAVGSVLFNEGCGLYVLAGVSDGGAKRTLDGLFCSLAASGLGGRRSEGLGKFLPPEAEDLSASQKPSEQALFRLLRDDGPWLMTLNTSLPADGELETALSGGRYFLCRRGGFVQSAGYADTPQKKKTVYALAPGACVRRRFAGCVRDVSAGGRHPVYRCLKPMFAGLKS